DVQVTNNYEYQGLKSPHLSYGYLRTPEVAEVINYFLTDGKERFIDRMRINIMKKFAQAPKQKLHVPES
ncbi:MAG: hypothetical protein ABII23_08360, partial [bacterium]